MVKWIVHIPQVGEDAEAVIPFQAHEEALCDQLIDSLILHTALEPRVEWV